MANIALLGGMIFALLAKLPLPDDCAALRAWHGRMQERASVAGDGGDGDAPRT
jgi:glutathione S-transferase